MATIKTVPTEQSDRGRTESEVRHLAYANRLPAATIRGGRGERFLASVACVTIGIVALVLLLLALSPVLVAAFTMLILPALPLLIVLLSVAAAFGRNSRSQNVKSTMTVMR